MVSLQINGEIEDVDAPPDMPLLWVLRDILGMTGAATGIRLRRLPVDRDVLSGKKSL